MKIYNRVCARVDLDAVEYNIEMMKKNIGDGVRMLAVVKTDGYGHGAVQVAKLLEPREDIWGFAVATLEEAVLLKERGIEKPVVVLGCVFPDQFEEAVEHEIRITVYTEEMLKGLLKAAGNQKKKVYIHVKLDTGMSRLGFLPGKKSVDVITEIAHIPGIVMEGLYTHFARADEVDKEFTDHQIGQYIDMKRALEEKGVTFSLYHCSNSAGIIDVKEANMDLVRAGIAMYGLYPSEEVKKENVPLRPALELVSHVAHVKWVDEGTPVSYGGTYITKQRTRIATIPIGYGDGYPRSLSNSGYVLIRGQKAPILGRICMDQFMVDVTDIPGVKFADKVTLIGTDGEEHLPVETLSDLSGRFNYEFVCDLGKRIPREYIRHGEVIEQKDWFF